MNEINLLDLLIKDTGDVSAEEEAALEALPPVVKVMAIRMLEHLDLVFVNGNWTENLDEQKALDAAHEIITGNPVDDVRDWSKTEHTGFYVDANNVEWRRYYDPFFNTFWVPKWAMHGMSIDVNPKLDYPPPPADDKWRDDYDDGSE